MPDDVSTPEKEPAKVTPVPAAESKPRLKPKKKKTPAKKPTVTPIAESKFEVKPALKPVSKPTPKPASASLLFTKDSSARKPERKAPIAGSGGPSKLVAAMVAVLFVGVIALFAWNKAQIAVTEGERTATDLRAQVDGEVSGIKDRLQQIADELQAQKQKQQEAAYSEYGNDELGIAFRYPQNLGEVQAQTDEVKGKKSLTLTFSANPDLWLVASVADNTSSNEFLYDGSTKDLASTCKVPLSVSTEGYCDLIAVLGSQTVEQVRPIGEDALLNVVKTVPMNLTAGSYAGLTVNIGLGLPPVTGRDLFAEPSEKELDAALEQFFRNLIKREQMSLVVRENLNAFQTILTSMRLTGTGS